MAVYLSSSRQCGLSSHSFHRLSQPLGQTSNRNVMVPKRAVYLAALVAFKRSQCAVSEFNVKNGDIAAVAHSSTGQSIALLLFQRRHLATVVTARTHALCRKVPLLFNEYSTTAHQ